MNNYTEAGKLSKQLDDLIIEQSQILRKSLQLNSFSIINEAVRTDVIRAKFSILASKL